MGLNFIIILYLCILIVGYMLTNGEADKMKRLNLFLDLIVVVLSLAYCIFSIDKHDRLASTGWVVAFLGFIKSYINDVYHSEELI